MVDVIFFSGQIQPNGEVKLVRVDKHIDLNPSPKRVDIVIHDATQRSQSDPILTVFYEPKQVKRD